MCDTSMSESAYQGDICLDSADIVYINVIARPVQEVQEIRRSPLKRLSTDQQGFKAVNDSKLPLLAIQAIKEQ